MPRSADVAIGVDIGGTKVMAGVLTRHGPVSRLWSETPRESAAALLATVLRLVRQLVGELPPASTIAVGVGSAGQIDPATGTVRSSTHTLPLAGLPLGERLASALGRPVQVLNDGDAAALAEALGGAALGCRSSVTVMLGTGIGAGVYTDGRLLQGAWGRAAEIGHLQLQATGPLCACGRRGCAEALASGQALNAAAWAMGLADARALFHAARQGATQPARAVATAARWTARLLQQVVVCYDPDRIVLGGSLITGTDGFYLERIRQAFRPTPYLHPLPPLVPAGYGPDAVWVGAALAALSAQG